MVHTINSSNPEGEVGGPLWGQHDLHSMIQASQRFIERNSQKKKKTGEWQHRAERIRSSKTAPLHSKVRQARACLKNPKKKNKFSYSFCLFYSLCQKGTLESKSPNSSL